MWLILSRITSKISRHLKASSSNFTLKNQGVFKVLKELRLTP